MLIVLLSNPDQPLHWWRLERDGQVQDQGCDPLSVLQGRYPGARVKALLADGVNLLRASLPGQRAAALKAALPFALEEQLSQDVDELHIVMGPRRSDSRISAAVVERRLLEQWLEYFSAAGLRLEALLPVTAVPADAVPAAGVRVQASPWPQDARWLVTDSAAEAVLLEQSMLAIWLRKRLLERDEAERAVELAGEAAAGLEVLLPAGVSVTRSQATLTLQQQFAVTDFNLLSGPYAVSMAPPPWRVLRPALVAMAATLVLGIGWLAAERYALQQQRDALQLRIERSFSEALPGERMLDPAMQFRQRLNSASGGGAQPSAGQLLYAVYSAVGQQQGVEVKQLRGSRDELEVELKVATFANLEQLRSQLTATRGVSESLLGADSDSGSVTARLRITRSDS
ncbi:type II secretion system protein GspL [Halopseudomonas oceani]|uniref:type II secretion system protein GspL n=1 Tax=Halopseudomonas oceani TaxID=1708783 RepID=UPI002AA7E50D|nr:type II secretion system protein GspL [Halopseudomonas oceani]